MDNSPPGIVYVLPGVAARPGAGCPYERNKYPQTTPLNRREYFSSLFSKKTCKSLRIPAHEPRAATPSEGHRHADAGGEFADIPQVANSFGFLKIALKILSPGAVLEINVIYVDVRMWGNRKAHDSTYCLSNFHRKAEQDLFHLLVR